MDHFNALAEARLRLEVEKTDFAKKILDNLELIPEPAGAVERRLLPEAIELTNSFAPPSLCPAGDGLGSILPAQDGCVGDNRFRPKAETQYAPKCEI